MSIQTNVVREIVIQAIPNSAGQFEYRLVNASQLELGPDGNPSRAVPLPVPVAISHLGDFVTRLASQSAAEKVEEQRSAILVPGGRA